MLTGDKAETAEIIAISSGIKYQDDTMFKILQDSGVQDDVITINKKLEDFESQLKSTSESKPML